MKTVFFVLVLVASGYLIFTQTKAGNYLSGLMPTTQFEQMNNHLTNKLEHQLEHSLASALPELINQVKADLQQTIDDKLAEISEKKVIDDQSEEIITTNNKAELEALVTQINVLTQQVESLLPKTVAATETNTNAKSDVQINNSHLTGNEYSTALLPKLKSGSQDNTVSSSNDIAQKKLKLQSIADKMNQQTLALLAN